MTEVTRHACGCTATRPCQRAAVLFAKRMSSALTAHLERALETPPASSPQEKLKHFRVPTLQARTWARETAPLRAFLQEAPRDWPELHAWADRQRIPEYRLHNQIAWLEGAKLARAIMTGAPDRPERQHAIWRAV